MARLHILNKGPDHPRFRQCLAQLGETDELLLIENAVMLLVSDALRELPPHLRVHALTPDVQARGLQSLAKAVYNGVGYDGFVALTADADSVVQW